MADFELFAGDTKTLVITVVDENGNPVDLTGATVRWWASQNANTRPPLIKKEIGSGLTITDAAQGKVSVELAAQDTEALIGALYYETEIVDEGQISTVLSGTFNIMPSLIKPEP